MTTQLTYSRGNAAQTIVFDSATRVMTFEAELTDSPQEKKATATDGWINKPDVVTLNAKLTDYPLSLAARGIGGAAEPGRASRLFAELVRVKEDGLLCQLSTPIREFTDVRIKSITLNQDKPEAGALSLTINLRQSVVADSQTVALVTKLERKPQSTDDKGKKNTDGSDANKKNKSYLAKGIDGIKNGLKQLIPEDFKR